MTDSDLLQWPFAPIRLDFGGTGSQLTRRRPFKATTMDTLLVDSSEATGPDKALFTNSSLREKILEHQFVGELLRVLWCKGMRQVELLKAEVDAGGYDLVLECNGVTRHVQLKSSYRGAKTSRVNIHVGLQRRDSGCVIWIMFDPASTHRGRAAPRLSRSIHCERHPVHHAGGGEFHRHP
jgi:hypothetical protein